MYGFSSREALSKRQSRWVHEVDKEVRNNPAQNALSKEPASNSVKDKPSIISMMSSYDIDELNALQSRCEDLNDRCCKLEKEYKIIKKNESNLLTRLEKLERLIAASKDAVVENKSEFVPYAIKEDFAGRDNISTLKGSQFYMLVEIVGKHTDPLVIYPFGSETSLPHFDDCQLELMCNSKTKLRGTFTKRSDGIYVIYLNDFKEDDYTYPLKLSCQTKL